MKTEPWKSGFAELAADSHSSLDYKMKGPFETTGRTPDVHLGDYKNDMQAVYNLARMWYFTGNEAYAKKGRQIMIAWATTHKKWTGAESYLTMGDYAYRMYGGADILRGTWKGWSDNDTKICKAYFEKVFWWAGTAPDPLRSANQGIIQLATGVGVAAFNDDSEKFEQCLRTFRSDPVGGLANSLPNGEMGDFGRDQGHGCGQLWTMTWIAEVFWKQGVDVYSDLDNRLLAAGEYYARYNLGVPTPWLPFGTKYDYYLSHGGSPEGAKRSADVFNLIQGAYVVRKGLSAPYVVQYRDARGENIESFVFRKTTDASTAAAPTPLPQPTPATPVIAGLKDADLGGAQPAGGSSYRDGTWTIRGGGKDIWGGSDSCHFTFASVRGDFTLIARLTGFESGDPDGTVGLIMRDTPVADAKRRVYIGFVPRSGQPPLVQTHLRGYTANSHNKPDERTHDGVTLPQWLKLQRVGTRITVFHCPDGVNWTAGQNAEYAGWTGDALVGLGISSHENGKLATATFTDVRLTGGTGPEMPRVPAAPFAIYGSPGNRQVPLRWLPSADATDYTIKRATTPGGPYTKITTVQGTSYIDTGVENGRSYYYVVTAGNIAGSGPDSPEEVVTPGAVVTPIPKP